MMKKKVIVCVTNDLCTDQRVHRTCLALQKTGFDVLEYGRLLSDSLSLNPPYSTLRKKLFFNKGVFFYAEYNIRLFFFLLFSRFDLVVANDLDTLPAVFFSSKIRGKKIIYDSHEYFTEVPELVNRRLVQHVWVCFEKLIFPCLETIITVNESIARLYEEKYHKQLHVVRNIPIAVDIHEGKIKSRAELGLPTDKRIIIIQGAGINIDRGAEEACLAMEFVHNAVLLIVGKGDALPTLKQICREHQLNDKIIFKDKMPFEELRQYTMNSDLGLAIDKNTNLNYHFALPNKLFDYIHSNIPVLCSDMPEIRRIIDQYDIGYFIENHNPEDMSKVINEIFDEGIRYEIVKNNTLVAKKELVWENEEQKLLAIFGRFK